MMMSYICSREEQGTGRKQWADSQIGRAFTLMSHVQAGRGAFCFFLRILRTLARVNLGLPPVR